MSTETRFACTPVVCHNDTLIRRGTDLGRGGLSCHTNCFHDHVPLHFIVHIFLRKGQRVARGMSGREKDGIGTVRTDPIDDGGEHEVGGIGSDFGNVGHAIRSHDPRHSSHDPRHSRKDIFTPSLDEGR